jgi:hypothetical protein
MTCFWVFITSSAQLSYAQTQNHRPSAESGPYMEITLQPEETGTVIEARARNLERINKRAIRQFISWYREIQDEQWYHVSNGLVVKFHENGLDNMAAFDVKGRWLFTITYLDEKLLSERINYLIKSVFYDYQVTQIELIQSPLAMVYIVHMQNETSWKNVRIQEDEAMDIIQDFNKN